MKFLLSMLLLIFFETAEGNSILLKPADAVYSGEGYEITKANPFFGKESNLVLRRSNLTAAYNFSADPAGEYLIRLYVRTGSSDADKGNMVSRYEVALNGNHLVFTLDKTDFSARADKFDVILGWIKSAPVKLLRGQNKLTVKSLIPHISIREIEIKSAAEIAAVAESGNLLENGLFTAGFNEKGIARGWIDDSAWAPVTVVYSEDKNGPQGKSAQKISCTSFRGGAVQFAQTAVPIEENKSYAISLWMKGDIASAVEIQVRRSLAPYHTYIYKRFVIGSEWKQYSFSDLAFASDPQARLIIKFISAGTLCLADLVYKELTEAPAGKASLPAVFKPQAGKIPASYFGNHMHRLFMDHQWFKVPVGTWRLHDSHTSWPWLEKSRGE